VTAWFAQTPGENLMTRLSFLALAVVAGCSSSSTNGPPSGTHDAAPDAASDAHADASVQHEAGSDAAPDATTEATVDANLPTVALLRLANWSPDAPGIDLCIATHGTSSWTGPLLAQALGASTALGHVTVVDAGITVDSGTIPTHDAGTDAGIGSGLDAATDAVNAADAGDASSDAFVDAGHETGDADAAAPPVGVLFPGVSPYLAVTPGAYDVRVVAAGSSCTTALVPDTDDLPVQAAGTTFTLAVVGDTTGQGSDPPAGLVALTDDTTVPASRVALRFIDAVPSVIETTFAQGTIDTASAVPYVSAAQFGGAGADTDAGSIDPNDYLTTAPITNAIWSLINANGGTTTLVAVEGASIPAGRIATVVGVGGESGPGENNIGILLCSDTPPIVAGESATCSLLEAANDPVCPSCP
jgi:hypothetical protein